MKTISLQFTNADTEEKFQIMHQASHQNLLKLFLLTKITILLVNILIDMQSPILSGTQKQNIVVLGCTLLFELLLFKSNIKLSVMVNLIQITVSSMFIITDQLWSVQQHSPKDGWFLVGGFKTINMAFLLLTGTNYLSNSLCYLYASAIYTYQYCPNQFKSYAVNYILANLWLLVLKYIVDKNRRTQFLLNSKDQYWTHIMKDIIDDWVIMVAHSSSTDSIIIRDANQNFKTNCQIYDDQNFRSFIRQIRVQTIDTYDKNNADSFDNLSQQENLMNKISSIQALDTLLNNNLDLEQLLRNNLFLNNFNSIAKTTLAHQAIKDQIQNDVKVQHYIGIQLNIALRKYVLYSIKIIQGSDYEPFILLVVKKLKQKKLNIYYSKHQLIKKNLVRMSILCSEYFKLTQQFYNEFQEIYKSKTIQKLPKIISNILTIENSHYVHQLYLNQIYEMKEFQFQSSVSTFEINDMVKMLQKQKKNQIRIILQNENKQPLMITSFARELMHLFLILIENTIKHSQLSLPKLLIKIDFSGKDVIKLNFEDNGIGVSNQTLDQVLYSYRVVISRDKPIQIVNHLQYTVHIRQAMKYGWLAARLLMSTLSPLQDFTVLSTQNKGCSIGFSIYKSINEVVKLRNLNYNYLQGETKLDELRYNQQTSK